MYNSTLRLLMRQKPEATVLFGYPPMNLRRCGNSTMTVGLEGKPWISHGFSILCFLELQPSILAILAILAMSRAFASCRRSCPAGSTSFISAGASLRRPVQLLCWRSRERGRHPRCEPGGPGVASFGPFGTPKIG